MMRHYYVYYRVDAADAHTLEPLLRSMQARLECRTGVTGRVLKRCDETNLWMEVYENVAQPEHFENALQKAVEESEIEMFLAQGSRRVTECFSD